MKKRPVQKRLISLLIVLVLLLGVSTGALAAAKEPVHFSAMQYVRPDADGMIRTMNTIRLGLDKLPSMDALELALQKVRDDMADFSTMYILAFIYSGKDMRVEKWQDELALLAHASPAVDEAWNKLYQALPDCKFAGELELELGKEFMEELRALHIPGEEEMALQRQMLELQNRYEAMLVTATVEHEGETLTINDILAISDYEAYQAALIAWLKQNHDTFAQMYIKQIKLRQAHARLLGYRNVTEMEFEAYDYTPEQVKTMLDTLASALAPVVKNVRTLRSASGGADVEVSLAEFSKFQQYAYPRISSGLMDTLSVMEQYGTYDYAPGAYKTTAQYSTFLEAYGLPFIMASYTDDLTSVTTLNHEMGHSYHSYTMPDEANSLTMDIAEIHSHALELLASNYFSAYFGAQAGAAMQKDVLYRIMEVMQQTAAQSAMELRLYGLDPDSLTPETIARVCSEEALRFGYEGDGFKYGWITDTQLITVPFYMVSYSASCVAAAQIWELSLKNSAAAAKAYDKIVRLEGGDTFLALTKSAGLSNPFSSETIQSMAALFDKRLISTKERAALKAVDKYVSLVEYVEELEAA